MTAMSYNDEMETLHKRIDRLEDRLEKERDECNDRVSNLQSAVFKVQISALVAIVGVLLSVSAWLVGHPIGIISH